MNVESIETVAYSEADVQAAISAIKNKQYPSIRKAAAAFNVPYPTLRGRVSGRKSRSSMRLIGFNEGIFQPIDHSSVNHGCSGVMVGSDTTISDELEKRSQDSCAPVRNAIYPPKVLEPLRHHAARALYFLSSDPAITANLTHKAILLAQTCNAQHRHEVLSPSKQVRHKMFSITRWREKKRPYTGGFDGVAALIAIVCSGELRKV